MLFAPRKRGHTKRKRRQMARAARGESRTRRVRALPDRFIWWNLTWARAHINPQCTRFFLEKPGWWGERRPRSGSRNRAQRETLGLCGECFARYLECQQGDYYYDGRGVLRTNRVGRPIYDRDEAPRFPTQATD